MPDAASSGPRGKPGDERMTDAEFRVAREYLGLTGEWLAQHLGVSSRTVRHWEQGRFAVPDGVRLEMDRLKRDTAQYVAEVSTKLMDMPEPAVFVYRTDAEFHADVPDSDWPASWQRAAVARIAHEVHGLRIDYKPSSAPKES